MKYRAKAEKVDAIQIRFGKSLWPEWLKGRVAIQEEESTSPDNCQFVNDGEYVVREGARIAVYSPAAFATKYERVREPKKAQS